MRRQAPTLLVVEDNDLDVEKIQRGVKRLKMSNPIIRAVDGQDALDTIRGKNGLVSPSMPFIVILDLNMPRMNGIEFLEELRQDPEWSSTPVFVFTTSKRPQDIQDANRYNVSGFIAKPFSHEEFLETLETLNKYWELCEYSTN